MTLRRLCIRARRRGSAPPGVASAATFETTNFIVEAPTAELAQQVRRHGRSSTARRRRIEWLGREMPPGRERCPLQVKIDDGLGRRRDDLHLRHATATGRSSPSQHMEIRGDAKQLLNSVLPHEVTHTVLAHHFGRAGAAVGRRGRQRAVRERRGAVQPRHPLPRTPQRRPRHRAPDSVPHGRVPARHDRALRPGLLDHRVPGREGRRRPGGASQAAAVPRDGNGQRLAAGRPQRYHGTPESWNEACPPGVRCRVRGWYREVVARCTAHAAVASRGPRDRPDRQRLHDAGQLYQRGCEDRRTDGTPNLRPAGDAGPGAAGAGRPRGHARLRTAPRSMPGRSPLERPPPVLLPPEIPRPARP